MLNYLRIRLGIVYKRYMRKKSVILDCFLFSFKASRTPISVSREIAFRLFPVFDGVAIFTL